MNRNWKEVKRMLSGLAALLGVAGLCVAAPKLGAQTNFVNSSPYGIPAAANNHFGAMAADALGNLYAVNADNGSIDAFPAGSQASFSLPISGIDPNNSGLACDGMGNLYIANDKVLQSGYPVGTFQKYTPGGGITQVASGWYQPIAVAVDNQNNIFVLDLGYTAGSQVWKIAAGTNTRVSMNLTGISQFAVGLAVDPSGALYVMNQPSSGAGTATLLKYPAGQTAPQTLVSGIPYGGGFDVHADPAGNIFYAALANAYTARIFEIPARTSAPFQLAYANVAGYGKFAVDLDDRIYYLNHGLNGVYTLPGIQVLQAGPVEFGPKDICVAGWNTVAECTSSLNLQFSNVPAGSTVAFFQSAPSGIPSRYWLQQPIASKDFSGALSGNQVAVNFGPTASGIRTGVLQILDSGGNVLSSVALTGTGLGPQSIYTPMTTVAVGSQGTVVRLAADESGDLIAVSGTTVGAVHGYAPTGTGNQTYSPFPVYTGAQFPQAGVWDGLGNLYLADTGYNRIEKITTQGNSTYMSNISPYGLATDGVGNLYYADPGQANLGVIPVGGGERFPIPNYNLSAPQWVDVAVDGSGNIYGLDKATNQVHKLVVGATQWTSLGSFSQVCALAVDEAGDVFVGDQGANAVMEVPAGSTTAVTFATGFQSTCAVATDRQGNVYAVDQTGGAIVKYQRSVKPSFQFAATQVGSTSSDSPQSVVIGNVGNGPLLAAGGLNSGTNFSQVPFTPSSSETGIADCTETFWLEPGNSCGIAFTFTPTQAGPLATNFLIASNANPSTVTMSLTGTGTDKPAAFAIFGGNSQLGVYGSPVPKPLSVVVQDAGGAGIANVSVTFAAPGMTPATATVVTNTAGIASFQPTFGRAGSFTVTATTPALSTALHFNESASQASLIVTPLTVYETAGQPLDLTHYTISGLVGSDTYTGAPLLTTTATTKSPVGEYPLNATAGTLRATANYKFVFGHAYLFLDTPYKVTVFYGAGQSASIGQAFGSPIQVGVFGINTGRRLLGTPVAISSSQMTFSPTSEVTHTLASSITVGQAIFTATPTVAGTLTGTVTVVGTNLTATFTEAGVAAGTNGRHR